jgi:hypothetical protein
VLLAALTLPLQRLADLTAHLTLVVFALVNLALAHQGARARPPTPGRTGWGLHRAHLGAVGRVRELRDLLILVILDAVLMV